MEIIICRKSTNHLYTMGDLLINGMHQTFTVENTRSMLRTGSYIIRIVKRSARKQSVSIFRKDGTATGCTISIKHSWIGSRKSRSVVIGTPLIPGAMRNGAKDYERISNRLAKCAARNEPITLCIRDSLCGTNHPAIHWLEPSDHPCQ